MAGWKLRRDLRSGKIHVGTYETLYGRQTPNWEEIPNFVFEDTLIFDNIVGYRDDIPYATFNGATQQYKISYNELNVMIPLMVNGSITGKFTFKKHGKKVSVIMVTE